MPTIYRENVYFQIHAVEHEVSETWSTTLKAFMKVKPGALGTEDVDIENQRVTKDYLNKLEYAFHLSNSKHIFQSRYAQKEAERYGYGGSIVSDYTIFDDSKLNFGVHF